MKLNNLLLIPCFIILVILFNGCRQSAKEEYYPSGVLKSKIEYKGGKQDGLAIFYSQDGFKELEISMKNGKKEGRLRKFFFNGNIETEEYYKNDVLDGKQILYDLQGIKTYETEYVNGIKNGPYCAWWGKDRIKTKGAFKEGLSDGKWEYYDERGYIAGEATFNKGTGDQIHYDRNGMLAMKNHYIKDRKNGEETYYNSQGNVIKTIVYKDDRMISIDGNLVSHNNEIQSGNE